MFRRISAVRLCEKKNATTTIVGNQMPIFAGSAPERMMRGIRAQEAAKATKRAAEAFDQGDIEKAQNEWKGAVETLKRCGLGEDVSVLEPMNNLACAVGELGRGKEKLELLNEHSSLTKKLYGGSHPQYVVALYNRAAALGEVGRPKEMMAEMEKVLELQKSIIPEPRREKHPKVGRVLLGLADAYGRCGMFEERWNALQHTMPIVINHVTNHHPQVAAVYLALCDASLDLWYSRRRFGDKTSKDVFGDRILDKTQHFVTVEDIVQREAAAQQSNDQKTLEELKKETEDRVVSLLSRPRTPTEAAKQALLFSRKAFEIESKVIPSTSSHLLTHSRLALARSRSSLSPQLSFLDIAPFIGDIRDDIIRHTNDTGKLLIPVLAFAAQDAARRVILDENFGNPTRTPQQKERTPEDLRDLAESAMAMSEAAFQVSIRHFDATGHVETPRRLVELAAVHLGCNYTTTTSGLPPLSTASAEEKVEVKIERWCKEALRRFDALGSETDFVYRVNAEKMLKLVSSNNVSITQDESKKEIVFDIVRETLKF